eukprot:m.51362 g.51362  ORF g.51362 m.51362 type:complete len:535 (+) comp7560_c1_seq2:283-1887(+)
MEELRCSRAQEDVVKFLCQRGTYELNKDVKLMETHCCFIFLVGDEEAYKLEREVKFPFMDLSTLALRKVATFKEFELNGATSTAIYRGVSVVVRKEEGLKLVHLEGPEYVCKEEGGEVVEYLVRMQQFRQEDILINVALRGEITMDMMKRVVSSTLEFHEKAQVYEEAKYGSPSMKWICADNMKEMVEFGERNPPFLDVNFAKEVGQGCVDLCEKHSELLDKRLKEGKVRFCHGDLHLRNIVLINGEPQLFDCIEFNDTLAITDVMYDFSFLLMDLLHRDMKEIANLVLNSYIEQTNDIEGLLLVPLFIATRAMIRAKVTCATMLCVTDEVEFAHERQRAEMYLRLARSFIHSFGTLEKIIAIGGFSGSGKTCIARKLASCFPGPIGAICLRADVLRKHSAHVALTSTLPPSEYTVEKRTECYLQLISAAMLVLKEKFDVVLDATFSSKELRDLLCQNNIRQAFWMSASFEVRLERISARDEHGDDASDMTAQLLKRIKVQGTEPSDDETSWVYVANEGSCKDAVDAVLTSLRL